MYHTPLNLAVSYTPDQLFYSTAATDSLVHEYPKKPLLRLQAEKNLAWEAAQAQAASMAQLNSIQNAGMGPCKLLVSNLHPNIGVSPLVDMCD
jgi:hypothetical protein